MAIPTTSRDIPGCATLRSVLSETRRKLRENENIDSSGVAELARLRNELNDPNTPAEIMKEIVKDLPKVEQVVDEAMRKVSTLQSRLVDVENDLYICGCT